MISGMEPALFWIIVLILFLILASFLLKGNGGLKYTITGNPGIDSEMRELTNFKFIKAMGEFFKKIGENRAKAKIAGNDNLSWIIPLIIAIAVICGLVFSAYSKYVGITNTVKKENSCTRQINGHPEYLPVGTVLVPGDICNGKEIVATIVPTQVPTQTPLPTTVFTPGVVEILPSATPVVAKEDNYPILTVKSGGISGVIGSWSNISASALSASQPVESKTCDLVGFGEKTKPQFIVPSWAQSAYLVFYEPNSLWEVTNTQLSISGDTITITLCKEDVVFELFAY